MTSRPHASPAVRLAISIFALAAAASLFTPARAEIVSVQIDGVQACSGYVLPSGSIATARSCIRDGTITVLPVLGPGELPNGARYFAWSASPAGDGVALLDVSSAPGKPSIVHDASAHLEAFSVVTGADASGPDDDTSGEDLQELVVAWADDRDALRQVCGTDCEMPTISVGGPVFEGGTLVGVMDDLGAVREIEFPGAATPLDPTPYAGVTVINACETEINQSLFWLSIDGKTWKDIEEPIPSGVIRTLPVATVGDALFSHASSGAGDLWDGTDIEVRIEGQPRSMAQISVPQGASNLVMVYDCTDQ